MCDRASEKTLRQRSFVLQELFQSEVKYVAGLHFVAEHFVQPLVDAGDSATADLVFNSWLPITNLHEDFLTKLQHAYYGQIHASKQKGADAPTLLTGSTITASRLVSKEFSEFSPFLKLYIPFVEKYNSALSRISADLRSAGTISRQIDITKARQDIKDGIFNGGLQPMLALPFQRLCKYGLLLRELSSTFSPSGRTGRCCLAAMQKVNDIVLKVNNAKAQGENGERLFEIQIAMADDKMHRIPSHLRQPMSKPLLQPSRHLLFEGGGAMLFQQPMPMMSPFLFDCAEIVEDAYLVLFSDILLINIKHEGPTKRREEKMQLLHCIELTSLVLTENKKTSARVPPSILEWTRPLPWSKLAIGLRWTEHDDGLLRAAFTQTLRMALAQHTTRCTRSVYS
jgi:hypothetical protein